jgi:hypothetical protein
VNRCSNCGCPLSAAERVTSEDRAEDPSLCAACAFRARLGRVLDGLRVEVIQVTSPEERASECIHAVTLCHGCGHLGMACRVDCSCGGHLCDRCGGHDTDDLAFRVVLGVPPRAIVYT